jgi:hypothetical protein
MNALLKQLGGYSVDLFAATFCYFNDPVLAKLFAHQMTLRGFNVTQYGTTVEIPQ